MGKGAKTMERVKRLESSTEGSSGIWEAVCMKSVVRNCMYEKCGPELERPYPSPEKGKEKMYKLGEIILLMGGSRRGT